MTAEEMLYRAEVGYDFITGFSAAGISKKEWSLFLTKAQFEIIKGKLPTKNRDLSFEETELLSEQFSELISDAVDSNGNLTTVPSLNQNGGIDKRSIFFDLPDDFLYGLSEKIEYLNPTCYREEKVVVTNSIEQFGIDTGLDGDLSSLPDNDIKAYMEEQKSVVISYSINDDKVSYYKQEIVSEHFRVKAINHNYYVANVNNPHKKPFMGLAWRLKAKSVDNKIRHELIPYKPIKSYYLRYLKMPSPIIIFDNDYATDTDEIQGIALNTITQSIDCILKDSICDIIINRAIMIAQINLGDLQAAQIKAADNASIN